MVFPDDCDLQPASLLNSRGKLESDLPLICLTSPRQSKIALNHFEILIIGAVTSNAYGDSEYPIWHASRISKSGFIHANFVRQYGHKLQANIVISQGTRRISANLKLEDTKDNRIFKVNGKKATISLKESIPENIYSLFLEQPYHTLCAVSEAQDDSALNKDFYKLFNIVGIDTKEDSIYLSGKVKTDQHCFGLDVIVQLLKKRQRKN